MNREQIRQYLVAAAVGLALFLASWQYNGGGLKLAAAVNRGLADASIVLLGTALLLGLLSRLYAIFDKWLTYRKELGVLAFFTGAAHVYLTMFPLARHGVWGFYNYRPLSAWPGLSGLVIMFFLFVISFKKLEEKLGAKRWWKLQYWGGRLAGLGVLVHLLVFRGPVWRELITAGGGEEILPSSLIVGFFAIFVLLSRLSELLGQKTARFLVPLWAIAAAGINVWLLL